MSSKSNSIVINQHAENQLTTRPTTTTSKGYKFSLFDWFCLWYPPAWLILFNRHWQHYHSNKDGWNWLEYALFLIPGGFYLALLSRWLRLGCRAPCREVSEFDPKYQQAFRQEVLAPIIKYHFQGELKQVENLPDTEPMIVAMNHAGMCFPWDFLTLGYLLGEARGWIVQPLAGVSLFEHPWVIWWLPPGWSQVLGGVPAELDDFEEAIAHRKILLYAPEGLRGPKKGWKQRYQLQTFDHSFVQLSQRYQIPILPVICHGNENLHPWTIHLQKLARRLQLPFLPISPLMPIFLLFPSMGVWANKSHLRYYIQPLYELSSTENTGRNFAYKQAQQLRDLMQHQVNELLIDRKEK